MNIKKGRTMPKLKKYAERRDLSKSKEPKAVVKPQGSKQIFVIQKHEASRLHYDFRLEIDGVFD